MRLIIDRIEGEYAVCEQEDKTFVDIPKNRLPIDVKEGDCLIENDSVYLIDYERTQERKNIINDRFNKLFK